MTTITASPPRTDSRWPDRLAPVAAGWLGLWGVLALVSMLTDAGYPFGPNDPNGGDVSLLRLVPVEVATPLFAGVLLTAAPRRIHQHGGRRSVSDH
ncbi:hypothetical protein ACWCO3_30305, partial [Micromonospora sp. NPDC002411]